MSVDNDYNERAFWSWLNFGTERGWISGPNCGTHDLYPMTEEEKDRFENGEDPCIWVLRLWTE